MPGLVPGICILGRPRPGATPWEYSARRGPDIVSSNKSVTRGKCPMPFNLPIKLRALLAALLLLPLAAAGAQAFETHFLNKIHQFLKVLLGLRGKTDNDRCP